MTEEPEEQEEEKGLSLFITLDGVHTPEEAMTIVEALLEKFREGITYDPETGEVYLPESLYEEWCVDVPDDIMDKIRAYQEKEPSGF